MPEQRKYCAEDFILTLVMTRPPAFIYLAALVGFVLACLIYVFAIRALFFRGGLPLAFGLMILIIMLLLKTQAKTITLYLDEKSIFINNVRYLRHEINTIVTNDTQRNNRIGIRIQLNNGNRLHITDARLFGSTDQQQKQTLQKMLNAIKKRLEIEPTYK